MSCTDSSIKVYILRALVKSCGLSSYGKSGVKLRLMLKSLRQHELPLCSQSVTHELVSTYKIKAGGDGLRSPQQRAFRLLTLMDPALEEALGTKRQQIKTGDFVCLCVCACACHACARKCFVCFNFGFIVGSISFLLGTILFIFILLL